MMTPKLTPSIASARGSVSPGSDFPALPAPRADGGQLFAQEVERASAEESGARGAGEAHRSQREASEARHANQAARAERNDEQRLEAREGHQRAAKLRKQKHEARRDFAAAGQPQPQPEPKPMPKPPAEARGPRSQVPEPQPELREQPAPEPPGRVALASLAGAVPQAPGGEAARAASASAVASAAPSAAPVQSTSESSLQGSTAQRGAPRSEGRGPAKGAAQPASFQDVLGELLVAREDALERQASVLRQVKAQLGPGAREISMQLSPAALGEISMRMSLRSGRLTAVVRATKREALDALQNQLPELTTSLEAQGFEVVDFDLGLTEDDPQT